MKVWNERSIYTESQKVCIQPNQSQDAVILRIIEIENDETDTRLHLTYDEARMLAKQINEFVRDNKV